MIKNYLLRVPEMLKHSKTQINNDDDKEEEDDDNDNNYNDDDDDKLP